ncbi:glutaredoxin 2 [Pseudovibrio axinellae]|uniref:Glutaredoxin 2 n=1 Tax=Pseudovibrio axinellae TaxID=989403 RepID=A0A166AT75_9HYPH|nr:glutathione S-transferase [Pseudovibrio axinellae]KZL21518.1 glutaredoxin 2 [Pseudovibrio axinellae]SER07962.1 Glutathione S-transferase [Pseudovibrio axinellae]
MAETKSLPILYSFRRCPYAMRARLGVLASQTTVALREIVLCNKPEHMLEISPKGTVPVLQLSDGTVIDESLDIMLWALRRNDPQHWLAPQTGTLSDMLALIEEMDGDFKRNLDRYKYSTRYEDADPDKHYALAIAELSKLSQRLEKSTYLFGDHPTLADQALFPFVRQFANANKERFEQQAPLSVKNWLNNRLEQPEFAEVFGTKWKPWSPEDDLVLFPHASATHAL